LWKCKKEGRPETEGLGAIIERGKKNRRLRIKKNNISKEA